MMEVVHFLHGFISKDSTTTPLKKTAIIGLVDLLAAIARMNAVTPTAARVRRGMSLELAQQLAINVLKHKHRTSPMTRVSRAELAAAVGCSTGLISKMAIWPVYVDTMNHIARE